MSGEQQQSQFRKRRRHRVPGAGMLTEQKIRNTATKLGLTPRPGESWSKFSLRVAEYLKEGETEC